MMQCTSEYSVISSQSTVIDLVLCYVVLCLYQYGDVETLLLSKKKGGSAIVEFRRQENAVS